MSTTEPSASTIDRANSLIASVVFFVNTTTSRSGSAPTKCPMTSRASSNAAVLTRDLNPVPRCTLEANGKNRSTASTTACSGGVVAALSRLT